MISHGATRGELVGRLGESEGVLLFCSAVYSGGNDWHAGEQVGKCKIVASLMEPTKEEQEPKSRRQIKVEANLAIARAEREKILAEHEAIQQMTWNSIIHALCSGDGNGAVRNLQLLRMQAKLYNKANLSVSLNLLFDLSKE